MFRSLPYCVCETEAYSNFKIDAGIKMITFIFHVSIFCGYFTVEATCGRLCNYMEINI